MVELREISCLGNIEVGDTESALLVTMLLPEEFENWLSSQPESVSSWVIACGFKAAPGEVCCLFSEEKRLSAAVVGRHGGNVIDDWRKIVSHLPAAHWTIDRRYERQIDKAAIGWALGSYNFDRYRRDEKKRETPLLLVRPEDYSLELPWLTEGSYIAQDLINMPSNDLGPLDLADYALQLADSVGLSAHIVRDLKELKAQWPAVAAVGGGSNRPPCVIELRGGDPDGLSVTFVGKGVCFDSGGLNLKPGSAMGMMKKDMGGAAHVLGLAYSLSKASCPLNLRVLIPAVENSVSGGSYRPGDVIKMRGGLTVEVGNTDAEGRLILADALSAACEENPDIIIDFATLTGAARVALGPDLPALFSNRDEIAHELATISATQGDPLWPMPLWPGYRSYFKGKVADLSNISNSQPAMAGSIIAALFLESFVEKPIPWVHLDIYGWSSEDNQAKAQLIRSLFSFLSLKAARRSVNER